jgi:mannose/fructose-specific phosphotransferase system component IIA
MIVGPQERFATVGMDPAADIDRLRGEIEAAVDAVGGKDAAVVFVDLMGGSPSNSSAYLAVEGVPVVCGANLPMLLEILLARESSSPKELAAQAIETGRESILNLGERLTGGGA